MSRRLNQDPTEFFSVAGLPFVRERHGHERRTDDLRPRTLEIGVATVYAACCAVALGVSMFSTSGAAQLVHVATNAVR